MAARIKATGCSDAERFGLGGRELPAVGICVGLFLLMILAVSRKQSRFPLVLGSVVHRVIKVQGSIEVRARGAR